MFKRWKNIILITLMLLYGIYSILIYFYSDCKTDQIIADSKADKGKLLWQKHNCTACHQIYGLGGYMGPDLTNVMSENDKGYGYAKAFIAHGTARMPDFNLDSNEIECLLSYLTYIDKTGYSPVYDANINMIGSIKVQKKAR